MSIRPVTCYIVSCTECRAEFCDNDGEIHFDSPDSAIRYVVDNYGWQLTENGDPICHRCVASAACRRDGHHFTEWTPCGCRGALPEHAVFGCGLVRACLRDGCTHLEDRTLAQLPTTEEPHALDG